MRGEQTPVQIFTEQVQFMKLPDANPYLIPEEVSRLILQATDGREDGWTAIEARKRLRFIASHINKVLRHVA